MAAVRAGKAIQASSWLCAGGAVGWSLAQGTGAMQVRNLKCPLALKSFIYECWSLITPPKELLSFLPRFFWGFLSGSSVFFRFLTDRSGSSRGNEPGNARKVSRFPFRGAVNHLAVRPFRSPTPPFSVGERLRSAECCQSQGRKTSHRRRCYQADSMKRPRESYLLF